MSDSTWARDDLQFPRLLSEIKAVGLSPEQVKDLCLSMDISKDELHELLDRAEEAFVRLSTPCEHEHQYISDRDLIYCADCGEELGR